MRNSRLTRSQQRVLDALRHQPDLVEMEALARSLGRHPNTLRDHIAALLAADQVVRYKAPSEGRGRPRWLYGAAGPAEVDENAEFAAALAWRVAHREPDPLAATREVARRWADEVITRLGLTRRRSPRAGREQVVFAFDELGYAPRADDRVDVVELTRCPMLQVASDVPEVACAVHVGLAEELLGASGADRTRVTLKPFASPGICTLRLLAPPQG